MAHKLMRLVALFLIPLGSYSQLHKTFDIGDSLPPITFSNIFNKSGASISLNDYKGKLIIIDFWNRWCGACIEAFPKMEKLQNEFGDKIKILLVTNDSDKELVKLFRKVKLPALTIISNDSILNGMFPHISVPHHVWINPDGRIQFITDGYNATAQNVAKVLEKKDVRLRVKQEATDFNEDEDLWKEGNGRLQKYINSYSFGMSNLYRIINTTHYGFKKDSINNACGFKFVNISLLMLYKIAFGGSVNYENKDFYKDNRVEFNVIDGNKFFDYPTETDSIPDWEQRNIISYESKWYLNNDSLAYQYLREDANRFFPFSVHVENKEVACYILKRAGNFNSIKSAKKEKLWIYTDSSYILNNMPVSIIIESLNGLELFKRAPVVDETNYSSNIDVHLINAFTDMATLKKQLLRNGLLLERGKRKMRMLVISPK